MIFLSEIDIFQSSKSKRYLILIILVENVFKIDKNVICDCFHFSMNFFFLCNIVCCINFTAFSYSLKYFFVSLIASSLMWRDLMFVIHAFTLSTDQYHFMIQMLFVNFFCLCWTLNVMIIIFYHLNSCLTVVENYKLC